MAEISVATRRLLDAAVSSHIAERERRELNA